jgi:hypothetical protein
MISPSFQEERVSEKSTRNDLDYVFESRAARNRSVLATANAALVAQNPSGGYNPSVSAQKKEIPGESSCGEQLRGSVCVWMFVPRTGVERLWFRYFDGYVNFTERQRADRELAADRLVAGQRARGLSNAAVTQHRVGHEPQRGGRTGDCELLRLVHLRQRCSFTLQTPVPSGLAPTVTFTVNGIIPQTAGGTWSGTYSATNANAGCSPVSGSFTAVPIQPVAGMFAGSANLGTGSSGSPLNLSVVMQQGSAGFVTTPNFVNSQNVLSGSITVQDTSCFTKGSLSLGQGSVDGGFVQAQFAMDDGSRLLLTGAIEDTAVSKVKLDSFLVIGGQCDRLFASGATDLVRQ